jgi:hypothetical protein
MGRERSGAAPPEVRASPPPLPHPALVAATAAQRRRDEEVDWVRQAIQGVFQ